MNNPENPEKDVKDIKAAYQEAMLLEMINVDQKIEKTIEALKGFNTTFKDDIDGIGNEINMIVEKNTQKIEMSIRAAANVWEKKLTDSQNKYTDVITSVTPELLQSITRNFVTETQKTKEAAIKEIQESAKKADNKLVFNNLFFFACMFSLASSLMVGIALWFVMDTFIVPSAASAVMEQIQVQQDVKKPKK